MEKKITSVLLMIVLGVSLCTGFMVKAQDINKVEQADQTEQPESETRENDAIDEKEEAEIEKSKEAEQQEAVEDTALMLGTETVASGLNNPQIRPDSDMAAGQKVTWDCVWFGNYPQAEVISSAENYTAIDKDLMKDGDIIADSVLYDNLKNSTEWDDNGEITLNGNRYRRI